MARIRSIHPGLFTDEAFVELSSDAQIFLVGLWTEADDQGVFEWKPGKLRMRLRPTKDGDVTGLLAELVAGHFIRPFAHGDRQYGAIRNFRRFQRPKSPNAIHPAPSDIRKYVAIDATISETRRDEAPAVPPNAETEPLMEDVFDPLESKNSPPPSGAPPSEAGQGGDLSKTGGNQPIGTGLVAQGLSGEGAGRATLAGSAPPESPENSPPAGVVAAPAATLAADPGSAPAALAPPKRGTRLPADWTLPDEWRAYAIEHGVNADREAMKFAAHFHSADCKRPVKKDWHDAWQRWVRTAVEYGGSNGKRGQHPSGFNQPFMAAHAEGTGDDRGT